MSFEHANNKMADQNGTPKAEAATAPKAPPPLAERGFELVGDEPQAPSADSFKLGLPPKNQNQPAGNGFQLASDEGKQLPTRPATATRRTTIRSERGASPTMTIPTTSSAVTASSSSANSARLAPSSGRFTHIAKSDNFGTYGSQR